MRQFPTSLKLSYVVTFWLFIIIAGEAKAASDPSADVAMSSSTNMSTSQAPTFDQIVALKAYPKIVTPNGDGKNDWLIIEIPNPAFLPLSGEIYDMTGARVATMAPGPVADASLTWDGKRDGKVVPSGTYIYKVSVGSQARNGTFVIAK